MVKRLPLSALNRKLLRDLLEMKGQAFAIAMVVAAGVAMFVMYLSNFDSLRRTQSAYYERQRFADIFASLKRAPLSLRDRIAQIPGVTAVDARVVASVTLNVPGLDEPASALLISVEAERRPPVNDLFLRRGQWIDANRPDEVLASEGFMTANRLQLGDQVGAVINGRLRRLTVVGIALSPEHIYNIRPGEIVPDDRRFATFWMERRALASAFDMEGGFNDVALAVSPGASVDAIIAALDRLIEPYGGLGAIPRALQLSNWTLENELSQLQTFGFILPLIFLSVAAFILNVALTRALALQRPQIAALKALGYANATLAWHYVKWGLLIAGVGVLIGVATGAWLGQIIIGLYNQFFRFPVLLYRLSPSVVLQAAAMTLTAASLGAFSAVRRAVAIPPAEAMRPEPPAQYGRSILEASFVGRHLGTAGRMVTRNLARHPFRAVASVVGIGFAAAILVVGFVFIDAMDSLITTQFSVAERQDVSVTFVEPRSAAARHALAHLPGVIAVEPQRVVPVRIRAGHRHRNIAITGVFPDARLRRIVDAHGRAIALPPSGLVLSRLLAEVLGIAAGDEVTIEVLEGRRPVRRISVAGLVDDVLGLSAYTDIDSLHDLMREGDVLSGAALAIDTSQESRLSNELKRLPAVAGAGFKSAVIRNFRETLAANMNISILFNVVFAGIIAFGVVYNAARVSLSERSRELASLRVLGFTRAEISLILLGELALLTMVALPAGGFLGYGMAALIVQSLDSEVYRFPLVVSRSAVAWAFLTVIAATLVSGLVVRRRLDGLDLVAVLKIRE
ncbi:MAG TPA: FtsX-like permease family protein [Vicinamibacterales bacterium]|nr:FtsX-like permease family protein [Vicinamibacterales bacterium]